MKPDLSQLPGEEPPPPSIGMLWLMAILVLLLAVLAAALGPKAW